MNISKQIDLESDQLKLLKTIINHHIPNKTVWAYGSRVRWNANDRSDLDLAVFDCNSTQIFDLEEALEESDLLISVYVLDWNNIPKSFKENIKKKYVVLQEKDKLNGWREMRISDTVKIVGGGTPKTSIAEYWGGDIPWLAPPDFVNVNRWATKTKKSITQLGLDKSPTKMLSQGDVIISARGTVGALAQLKKPMAFSQTNYGLKAIYETIDSDFLFYIMSNNINRIKKLSYGTTFDTITTKTFDELKVNIPPLLEQKAISEVLSSLDDKIDLLHRQNKTLESLAQILFRQWFVEDANDSWEEIKLGEFIKCTTGHSYRSVELQPSSVALVTLKNFARDGSFRMDGYKEFVGKFKDNQIVKQGDLVVSHTDITQEADIIGNPALIVHPKKYNTLVITMDLMKIESTEKWIEKEFLFYLFRSTQFKGHCLGYSNGTTVLHMNRITVPSYRFRIPSKGKVIKFSEIVKPNIDKAFSNSVTITNLQHLRDILLPKLMNGTIQINQRATDK